MLSNPRGVDPSCSCAAADWCPLGRSGSALRCTAAELHRELVMRGLQPPELRFDGSRVSRPDLYRDTLRAALPGPDPSDLKGVRIRPE